MMKSYRIFYLQSSNTFDFPIKFFCLVRRVQKELELNEIHQFLFFHEETDIMCANTNITKVNNRSLLAATRETGPVGTRLSLWTVRYRLSHMGLSSISILLNKGSLTFSTVRFHRNNQ